MDQQNAAEAMEGELSHSLDEVSEKEDSSIRWRLPSSYSPRHSGESSAETSRIGVAAESASEEVFLNLPNDPADHDGEHSELAAFVAAQFAFADTFFAAISGSPSEAGPVADHRAVWLRLQEMVLSAVTTIPLVTGAKRDQEPVFLSDSEVLGAADDDSLRDRVRAAVAAILQLVACVQPLRVPVVFRVLVVFGESYAADLAPAGLPVSAAFSQIRARLPPPACGTTWSTDVIVATCQTCASDQTCCFCMDCFEKSDHEGHDYRIHSSPGGMCDCGDPEAWDPKGFCSQHRGAREDFQASEVLSPLGELFARSAVRGILDVITNYAVRLTRDDVSRFSMQEPSDEALAAHREDLERSSLNYDAVTEMTWMSARGPRQDKHEPISTENVVAALRGGFMAAVDQLLQTARAGNVELWGTIVASEFDMSPSFFESHRDSNVPANLIFMGRGPGLSTTLDILFLLHNYFPQPSRIMLHELYHVLVPSYAFKRVCIRHFGSHYPHLLREAAHRADAPSHYDETGDILDLGAQIITVPSVCISVADVRDLPVNFGVARLGKSWEIRDIASVPRNIISVIAAELAGVMSSVSKTSRFIDCTHPFFKSEGLYWTPYVDVKYALQNLAVSEFIVGFPRGEPNSVSRFPISQAWNAVLVPRVIARVQGILPLIRRSRNDPHVIREPEYLTAMNFELNILRLCEVVSSHLRKTLERFFGDQANSTRRLDALEAVCHNAFAPVIRSINCWFLSPNNLSRFDRSFRIADTKGDIASRFGDTANPELHGSSVHIPLHRLLAVLFQAVHLAGAIDVCKESDLALILQLCFEQLGLTRGDADRFDLEQFLSKLITEPLRLQVLMCQFDAGLWIRNGSQAISGYSFSYHSSSLYGPKSFDRDIFILHIAARLGGSVQFVERAVEAFGETPVLTNMSDSYATERKWLSCTPRIDTDTIEPASTEAGDFLLGLVSRSVRAASASGPGSGFSGIMQRALAAARSLAHVADDASAVEQQFAQLLANTAEFQVTSPTSVDAEVDMAAPAPSFDTIIVPESESGDNFTPHIDFGLNAIAMLEAARNVISEESQRVGDAIQATAKDWAESCAVRVAVVTDLLQTLVSVLLETTGIRSELLHLRECLIHELAVRPLSHSQLSRRISSHLAKLPEFDDVLADVAERQPLSSSGAIFGKGSSQKFRLKISSWHEFQGVFWRRYSKQDLELALQARQDQLGRGSREDLKIGPLPPSVAGMLDSRLDTVELQEFRKGSCDWVARSGELFSLCFAVLRSVISAEFGRCVSDPHASTSPQTALIDCAKATSAIEGILREESVSFKDETTCNLDIPLRDAWEHFASSMSTALRATLVLLLFCCNSDVAAPFFLQQFFVVEHGRHLNIISLLCLLRESLSGTSTSSLVSELPLVESLISMMQSSKLAFSQIISEEETRLRGPDHVAANSSKRPQDVMDAVDGDDSSGSSTQSKRQRIKERQAEMMRKFKSQQRSFAQSQGDADDVDSTVVVDSEEKTCCLCHESQLEVDDDDGGMGLCSFVFRHSVIARSAERATNVRDPGANPNLFEHRDFGTVSSCGHTMHHKCLATYRESLSSMPPSRELARESEYACPMCRALCNVLVPVSNFSVQSLEPFESMLYRCLPIVESNDRQSGAALRLQCLVGLCTAHEFESRLGKVGFSTESSSVSEGSGFGRSSTVGAIILGLLGSLFFENKQEKTVDSVAGSPLEDKFFLGVQNALAFSTSISAFKDSLEDEFRSLWPAVVLQALFSASKYRSRGDDVFQTVEHLCRIHGGTQDGTTEAGEVAAFTLPFLRKVAFILFQIRTDYDAGLLFEYWNVRREYDVESNSNSPGWLSQSEASGAISEANAWCALLGWQTLSLCVTSFGEDVVPHFNDSLVACLPSDGVSPLAPPNALKVIDLPTQFEEVLAKFRDVECSKCGNRPKASAVCLHCGEVVCVGREGRRDGGVPEILLHIRECSRKLGTNDQTGQVPSQPWLIFVPVDAAFFALRDAPFDGALGAVFGTFVPSPYVDKYGEEDIGFKRGRPLKLERSRLIAVEKLWASSGGEQVLIRHLGSNLYRL